VSQYIAYGAIKNTMPVGESERLSAWPIYGPGASTFWGPTRVQAERLAEELNRLQQQLTDAERERDDLRGKIAALNK